jgi:hypothetical protein
VIANAGGVTVTLNGCRTFSSFPTRSEINARLVKISEGRPCRCSPAQWLGLAHRHLHRGVQTYPASIAMNCAV